MLFGVNLANLGFYIIIFNILNLRGEWELKAELMCLRYKLLKTIVEGSALAKYLFSFPQL